MGMGTGAAPGCRGMERYREMLEGEDARPFPMGQAKPYGEGWCLPMGKLKLCISIYREALKLEDRIGPQEFRLLGRYARAAGDPQKVARMTEYLASEAFEKEHGHADFSFRLGMEEEYTEFLGNKIVCHQLPIRPGRNLAIIVETAAINYRQKKMGYNAAQELYKRVQKNLTKK